MFSYFKTKYQVLIFKGISKHFFSDRAHYCHSPFSESRPGLQCLAFPLFWDLALESIFILVPECGVLLWHEGKGISARHICGDTTRMGNSQALQVMVVANFVNLANPTWDLGPLLPWIKDLCGTWSRSMAISQVWATIIISSYVWHFTFPWKILMGASGSGTSLTSLILLGHENDLRYFYIP